MKVAFRTDASLHIGTGHVMRCLTLANALRDKGAEVMFITREHPGNLIGFIAQKGFVVKTLPFSLSDASEIATASTHQLAHAQWLGVSQRQDAAHCEPILRDYQPDWLITDHYALDEEWQGLLRPYYKKLMVIDDLADRQQACDILLDQNYGRQLSDYRALTPAAAILLLGADYAILRSEFAHWRSVSLQRRTTPEFKQLLVTMGGIDADNVTGRVLSALQHCSLPSDLKITVVMSSVAPWLEQVKQQVAGMSLSVDVKVNITNMAELMANSDLAIGAAGSTSWERCCLGLPTVMVVLADNQWVIANPLERANAACLIKDWTAIDDELPALLNGNTLTATRLAAMSQAASAIVDGRGVERAIAHLEAC